MCKKVTTAFWCCASIVHQPIHIRMNSCLWIFFCTREGKKSCFPLLFITVQAVLPIWVSVIIFIVVHLSLRQPSQVYGFSVVAFGLQHIKLEDILQRQRHICDVFSISDCRKVNCSKIVFFSISMTKKTTTS